MTENEKRILTLLYKAGPLSKQELANQGRMGWATVVKLTNRLLDAGVIECVGTSQRTFQKGKNAYTYGLTNRKPLAIGIDVEYKATTMILTNLSGDIIASKVHRTPENPDAGQFKRFLKRIIVSFLEHCVPDQSRLAGIGIGIPGIGMPSWVKENNHTSQEDIAPYLEQSLGLEVTIEINTRAYTVFEKWENQTFSSDDFIYVSIRTGVGSGIFVNGNLLRGEQGLAGEIGHFKVVQDGLPCRCGGRGCLETVINQYSLFRQYRQRVLKESPSRSVPSAEVLKSGLSDLFSRAREGNREALDIVAEMSGYLGYCLSHAIMVLNLPQIIISGNFGNDGSILLDPLRRDIRRNAFSKIDFMLHYYPIDPRGHTRGAALLILKDYFTGIPSH
ncbi:MAG TPA: ROK family transcriptional regulator [Spirochaetia bacterium]|nr:ROK family transcriptional regulator [Spirochaetia bacterium]